jgi:hypothetical protein
MISQSIPLWNMTLTPFKDSMLQIKRIKFSHPTYNPDPNTMPDDMKPPKRQNEDEDEYNDRTWEWAENFRREHVVQPEPEVLGPELLIKRDPAKAVDLKRDYGHRGLQVIVKLANISLTPENPSYDGGSWHVEGQLVGLIHIPNRVDRYMGLTCVRTSTFAQQLCTTMIVKISQKAVSPFDNKAGRKTP